MLHYHNYDIVFQEIPDEITLAINITGCKNNCHNCHSKHLQEEGETELTKETIAALLSKYNRLISCVCFMGGDHNPKQVESLACYIKLISCSKIKTAWYSGKNDIANEIKMKSFDYIKLGAYIETLGGLRSKSTNQRLYRVNEGTLTNITERFWTK